MMRKWNHRRRGSMYVAVLGVAMIVTVIGLSALMATRVERQYARGTGDFAQARLYAQSAIEMGFFWISDDPDWRTREWEADQPIGQGTYTLEGIDPDDDNLEAEPNNSIILIGTGVQGEARYKLQVTVVPLKGGYELSPGAWRQVVD